MKFALALCLVLALAAGYHSSIVPAVNRVDLNLGVPTAWDRILYSGSFIRNPIAGSIQNQDWIYRGNASTIITSIRAVESVRQNATVWLVNGGLNRNNVTLRFQSAVGRGINYVISIFGR